MSQSYEPVVTLVGIFLAVLLGGCATNPRLYDGPPRPSEEIAVIIRDPGARVRISEIDGHYVPGTRFEVLPGRHTLRTIIRRSRGDLKVHTVCMLDFVAEAGNVYAVTGVGEIKRVQNGLFDFELAAWIAMADNLNEPIGGYECDMTEPTLFP